MARKVFFSFKYQDVSRSMVVRNSWVIQGKEAAGFIDKAEFEEVKKKGDAAIRSWIDKQLEGTSVTVVLVGEETCSSRWVKYEIEQSIKRGNGLLGIDISKIKNLQGETSERCGQIPKGYQFYLWNKDEGYKNMGDWIETAAKEAGK
ncbi:TIR domain-containing protein [Vibrio metschnikovii]|uniref:TIR domain-containing protein n=1 Tax=Vibrio metschnikovii TaxID=28172 RepID=UPI002FE6A95E